MHVVTSGYFKEFSLGDVLKTNIFTHVIKIDIMRARRLPQATDDARALLLFINFLVWLHGLSVVDNLIVSTINMS